MSTRTNNLLAFLLVLFCVGLVVLRFYRRDKLIDKHLMTQGRILNYYSSGNATQPTRSADYVYDVNGQTFKRSAGVTSFEKGDFNAHFVGKTFPVIYQPDNPSNSVMMIVPSTYELYGYDFPDSLAWVKAYLKE